MSITQEEIYETKDQYDYAVAARIGYHPSSYDYKSWVKRAHELYDLWTKQEKMFAEQEKQRKENTTITQEEIDKTKRRCDYLEGRAYARDDSYWTREANKQYDLLIEQKAKFAVQKGENIITQEMIDETKRKYDYAVECYEDDSSGHYWVKSVYELSNLLDEQEKVFALQKKLFAEKERQKKAEQEKIDEIKRRYDHATMERINNLSNPEVYKYWDEESNKLYDLWIKQKEKLAQAQGKRKEANITTDITEENKKNSNTFPSGYSSLWRIPSD